MSCFPAVPFNSTPASNDPSSFRPPPQDNLLLQMNFQEREMSSFHELLRSVFMTILSLQSSLPAFNTCFPENIFNNWLIPERQNSRASHNPYWIKYRYNIMISIGTLTCDT